MAEKISAPKPLLVAQSSSCFIAAPVANRSTPLFARVEPKSDRIQNALAYAKKNLRTLPRVERLAEAARLTSRDNFSRAFRAETGRGPAPAVEKSSA